jgi:hypothetical protein
MAYLDNNGVLYLWNKVKAYVSSVVSGLSMRHSSCTNLVVDATGGV